MFDQYPVKAELLHSLVTDLQSHGINVSDIKKLQEAGIVTIGGVLQKSMRDLANIKGLTEAKIEKVNHMTNDRL